VSAGHARRCLTLPRGSCQCYGGDAITL
jgi:hypothetical protein